MAKNCAWLRKFHNYRSRPTVEIDVYRTKRDSVLFSVSGSRYGAKALKKFILSLDDMSTRKSRHSTVSNHLEFTTMCSLAPVDIDSMIGCLQNAKSSVALGAGIQNTDLAWRLQFCQALDRTISAFEEAKAPESDFPTSTPSCSDFTDTTEVLDEPADEPLSSIGQQQKRFVRSYGCMHVFGEEFGVINQSDHRKGRTRTVSASGACHLLSLL